MVGDVRAASRWPPPRWQAVSAVHSGARPERVRSREAWSPLRAPGLERGRFSVGRRAELCSCCAGVWLGPRSAGWLLRAARAGEGCARGDAARGHFPLAAAKGRSLKKDRGSLERSWSGKVRREEGSSEDGKIGKAKGLAEPTNLGVTLSFLHVSLCFSSTWSLPTARVHPRDRLALMVNPRNEELNF